jgi:hypothetical protein
MKIFRRLLVGGGRRVVDELAVDERGAGTDERDQVRAVDRAPAVLGGLDELERHCQSGGPGARPAGDLRAVPDPSEGRLDRVRGAQVDPVLGGEVVDREQRFERGW